MSTRLLGTIALPLVLLTLLLSAITLDRYHRAETADRISDSSAVLKQLVRLRSALFRERLADEILVPEARRPPVDLLETTDFGFELVNDPEGMERETDEALADLAPDQRPFGQDRLDRMRLEPLGGFFAGGRMVTRLDDLDRRVVDRITGHLEVVSETSVDLGSGSLIGKARALQRSVGIPDQAGTLVAALVDLWSSPAEGRAAEQSAVADAAARLDTLSDLMTSTIVDPTTPSPELFSVTSMPPWEFRDAVASALRGELSDPSRAAGQPPSIGIAALASIDWLVGIDHIPTDAADAVRTASVRVAEDARRSAREAVGLALLALGASITGAVLFGRSIARPVRRFSDHALAVGRGRLDVEPLDLRGPPEIVRASQSFNVMVGNLVLLEQKSQALADSDFKHPSLGEPLPGLLGAALQRSIEVLSDSIEERERLQHRLAFEATHDPLTGLGNRAVLIEQLDRMQQIAERTGGSVAVVFIDLDDFKRVNDRHGHAVGDELLRTVALRMQQEMPASGMLARLGGDEFVCALPAVADPREATEVAHRLVAAVIEPLVLDGMRLEVGASAGVAVARHEPGDTEDPLELMRKADLAVYIAKSDAGAGSVSVYDDQLDRRLAREEDVAAALRTALEPGSDELHMNYQPIVDATTGGVVGFEALLRWDRAGHGRIPPDRFIPIAEESGLVLELDRWVFGTVLAQASTWFADERFDGTTVAVNVSGRSLLDPAFVDHVIEALAGCDLDPRRITLEVTETSIVTDMELAAAQLAALHRQGIQVAIDDFGTGYTSIAHLRALPVDTIKIDSSFVHRLLQDDNLVFVQMINQLAHQLGIPTVAEGVESAEQLENLRSVGCDRLQGYLFSRPLDACDVSDWLAAAPASLRPVVQSSRLG